MTFVQLPTDGAGKKLRTSTIGDEHAQHVVPVRSDGSEVHTTEGLFVVACRRVAKAASAPYLAVYNTALSGVVVEVTHARVGQVVDAAVTGLARQYDLFRFTSYGATGDLIANATIPRTDTTMDDPPALVVAKRKGAAALALVGTATEPLAFDVLGEEETGSAGISDWLWNEETLGKPITLREGEGVAVVQDSVAGVGLLSAIMRFRVI